MPGGGNSAEERRKGSLPDPLGKKRKEMTSQRGKRLFPPKKGNPTNRDWKTTKKNPSNKGRLSKIDKTNRGRYVFRPVQTM